MEKAISFLKRLHPVSASLEAELRNTLRFTKKRKNEFLLFEGEVCHYAWYLQKGLVRCYYKRDEHEVPPGLWKKIMRSYCLRAFSSKRQAYTISRRLKTANCMQFITRTSRPISENIPKPSPCITLLPNVIVT